MRSFHGDGRFALSSNGKIIMIGGEMAVNEVGVTFELPYTQPDAIDSNGDGLDDHLGWLMPYDSDGLYEGVDCENFRLLIETDQYGIETTFELFEGDRTGKLVANGGPYGSSQTYVADYCLASPREYELLIYDWDQRGLCCGSGRGRYRLTSGNVVIVDSNGNFQGEEETTRFILPVGTTLPPSPRPPHESTETAPAVTSSKSVSIHNRQCNLYPSF